MTICSNQFYYQIFFFYKINVLMLHHSYMPLLYSEQYNFNISIYVLMTIMGIYYSSIKKKLSKSHDSSNTSEILSNMNGYYLKLKK